MHGTSPGRSTSTDARRRRSALVGERDFSSFRAAGCDARTRCARVLHSEIERRGDLVVYSIEATAFLRHMVRNIVGSLVEVGQRRRSAAISRRAARRPATARWRPKLLRPKGSAWSKSDMKGVKRETSGDAARLTPSHCEDQADANAPVDGVRREVRDGLPAG
jgi:tRNA U38,U39,U40 pseudouridine synthase TruA